MHPLSVLQFYAFVSFFWSIRQKYLSIEGFNNKNFTFFRPYCPTTLPNYQTILQCYFGLKIVLSNERNFSTFSTRMQAHLSFVCCFRFSNILFLIWYNLGQCCFSIDVDEAKHVQVKFKSLPHISQLIHRFSRQD